MFCRKNHRRILCIVDAFAIKLLPSLILLCLTFKSWYKVCSKITVYIEKWTYLSYETRFITCIETLGKFILCEVSIFNNNFFFFSQLRKFVYKLCLHANDTRQFFLIINSIFFVLLTSFNLQASLQVVTKAGNLLFCIVYISIDPSNFHIHHA